MDAIILSNRVNFLRSDVIQIPELEQRGSNASRRVSSGSFSRRWRGARAFRGDRSLTRPFAVTRQPDQKRSFY